ncbi:MAG: sigma-70 family RNA polymerase sigma factor [Candidatus Aminicenantes bacterium]|nr:sigma-70 family RNA polymerase sigma factor [Candidatus Aminicenantes bacterium]
MTWEDKKIQDFEKLIERFSRYIEALIQQFNPQRNGIEPDDIFQEVKIKLWNIFRDEKKIYNYSSYLKKVVNSCVIDQIRKSRREEGIIAKEKRKTIADKKSHYKRHTSMNLELRNMVGETIESLIETRRKVVKLFLLNMTLDEISLLLNWSKDKTRNLLYRGLDDLKKKLREKGIRYDGYKD